MEFRTVGDLENALVEFVDFRIGSFLLCACKLNYQLSAKTLQLSVVEEVHSGNCSGENRCRQQARFPENGSSAQLVMVFEEADRARLELPVGPEVQVDVAHKAIAQAIVEPFVIGEVESELLQRPLRIAVGFGDPDKVRKGAGGFLPELLTRDGPRSQQWLPGLKEGVVQHEHRHVAASTVAEFRDAADFRDHGLAKFWVKKIDLGGVRPGREIGI